MPVIRLIEKNGTEKLVEFIAGVSLMEAATKAGVAGIIGECGGSCMCGTCHVYLSQADFEKLPPVAPLEAEALEFITTDARPTSRLGCQLHLTQAMDGLVFHVAAI